MNIKRIIVGLGIVFSAGITYGIKDLPTLYKERDYLTQKMSILFTQHIDTILGSSLSRCGLINTLDCLTIELVNDARSLLEEVRAWKALEKEIRSAQGTPQRSLETLFYWLERDLKRVIIEPRRFTFSYNYSHVLLASLVHGDYLEKLYERCDMFALELINEIMTNEKLKPFLSNTQNYTSELQSEVKNLSKKVDEWIDLETTIVKNGGAHHRAWGLLYDLGDYIAFDAESGGKPQIDKDYVEYARTVREIILER